MPRENAPTGLGTEGAPAPVDVPAPSPWAVEHAQELGTLSPDPVPGNRVRVELLTDPWSVWCWGLEPVRRTLEMRYPTVEFRMRVGGMFPELPDPDRLGFDVRRFFSVVQRTTGMPLRVDATERDRPQSTYPACVHAFTMRLLAPEKEAAYVRALREAVYLDARNVSRADVAADVAADLGVERDAFLEALATGEPARDHQEALAVLHAENLHAYPTFLVRSRTRLARVEGFQSLPALMGIVEGVSGRMHPAAPPPEPVDVIGPAERVATREVAEVLGVSVEQAFETLMGLAREGRVSRERHDTGDVWRRADA